MRCTAPTVSVVVPTRNRGVKARDTIASLLGNDHKSFEVIVVDQSESDETERCLSGFGRDERYRYIRSTETGASRARNQGAAAARADILMFTDDDCVVPTNWISGLEEIIGHHPDLDAVFCRVEAAEGTPPDSYTPVFRPKTEIDIRRPRDKLAASAMSAGLAIRRSALEQIGGFDSLLGPGSQFFTGEDYDLIMRLTLLGRAALATPDIAVIHHGWRDMDATRRLLKGDWISIGACYGKYFRARRWAAMPVLGHEVVAAVRRPLRDAVHWRRPRGVRQVLHLARGFASSLVLPIDRETLRFK